MIVDCFPFLNELDLLEIRLHELSPIVDKFVISEGTRTFTNKPKPLVFENNKSRFKEFLGKIEHVVMDDYSNVKTEDAWAMENVQKQIGLDAAMSMLKPGDFLIYGDCDEIPKAKEILRYTDVPFKMATLEMGLFYYYLNCKCISLSWRFGRLVRVHSERMRHILIRGMDGDCYIPNAGWHFSYLGDIKYKLDSSAHTEFGKSPYNTPEYIEKRVRECRSLFDDTTKFYIENHLNYLPKYVLDNQDKYGKYICRQQ